MASRSSFCVQTGVGGRFSWKVSVQGWAKPGLGNVVFNRVFGRRVKMHGLSVFLQRNRHDHTELVNFHSSQHMLSPSVVTISFWNSASSRMALHRGFPESLLPSAPNYPPLLRKYLIQLTQIQFRPNFDPPQNNKDTTESAYPYLSSHWSSPHVMLPLMH